MTGKPRPFSHRSRSNSREQRNHSRHRRPNKFSQNNSKPYYGTSNFKPPSRNGSHYPRPNFQNNSQNNSKPQSPHYNRDGNRSRRPFSRNRFHNVENYINSLLDQEQTDSTTPNTEKTDTTNVSEETLLEQQFNYLLLKLNQDTQDEYFSCQEKCNTLTEDYILFTSCKNNIWVLPLTIYTQQTLDHKRTISPPHLEMDFALDSAATLNILNTDTWNEIKENRKLQLKASTFVLSATNNSKLQSKGTVKLTLYPDVTESQTPKNTSFTLTFYVSKFNILGTPFLEKYVDSIKCSSLTLEIKHKNDIKSLKLLDSSIKPPPYYSQLFPIIGDHSVYFTPSAHRILTYSLTAYECKNKKASGTILYASDFSFITLRKNMLFSIMDINNLEYPYQSIIQKLMQNPLHHPLTLVKGIIGYAQQYVSLNDFQTSKYRINELTEFMYAYTLNYLTQCTSEVLKKLFCLNLSKQQEREYKSQQKKFTIPFVVSKFTETEKEFLTMFNFEHTKLTQTQFEKLAQLLTHFQKCYATSKFDAGKIKVELNLPLKATAIFNKQRTTRSPLQLQDRVQQLLGILTHFDIIATENTDFLTTGNTFINPVIISKKEIL